MSTEAMDSDEGNSLSGEVQEFTSRMVACLDWDLAVSVSGGEGDDNDTVHVELSGEDREIVVRNRAEILEVIQYLLNRIFARQLGDGRVIVDCDGFRARKEAELIEIANRVSERVRLTGRKEELGLMNPYERRIVHLALAEKQGVRTESAGDGLMKRVVIHPA
ncbi:MAG TPA: R3H domain-containing nucleic acid-binding protein [Vicinamibacteria bacterium]|nr:R3H domain-containing nucleic acid-binding protein [Vicinamibacteria bacterium]